MLFALTLPAGSTLNPVDLKAFPVKVVLEKSIPVLAVPLPPVCMIVDDELNGQRPCPPASSQRIPLLHFEVAPVWLYIQSIESMAEPDTASVVLLENCAKVLAQTDEPACIATLNSVPVMLWRAVAPFCAVAAKLPPKNAPFAVAEAAGLVPLSADCAVIEPVTPT